VSSSSSPRVPDPPPYDPRLEPIVASFDSSTSVVRLDMVKLGELSQLAKCEPESMTDELRELYDVACETFGGWAILTAERASTSTSRTLSASTAGQSRANAYAMVASSVGG
jgi:hypothetical protein